MKVKCLLIGVVVLFVVGLLAIPCIASTAAAEKGLLLYFPFDEGSGDKVKDLSGNGNHGIMHNCTWRQGKFGSALEFKGSATSFVEVPDSNTLSSWEALTVSVWVMLESYNQTWGRIVDKDGDPPAGVGYWLATRDGGAISAGFWNQPNTGCYIEATATRIELNKWTHLVFVWKHLGDFAVYFNGQCDQTKLTKNIPCNPTKGVSLFLGKPSESVEAAVAIECYAGFIDELAIYDYAFSENEIQVAMNGRLPGTAAEPKGKLIATWAGIKAR